MECGVILRGPSVKPVATLVDAMIKISNWQEDDNTPTRLYWMMRKGWDYEQVKKFGSHAGQPGHRDGVKSNIE